MSLYLMLSFLYNLGKKKKKRKNDSEFFLTKTLRNFFWNFFYDMLIPFWFDLPWHTLDTFSSYWQLEINFLIDIWDLSPTNFTWFVHEFLYKIHMVCTWTSLPILPILWRQMALQNDKKNQYYFWSYGHLAYKGISLYLILPSDYTTFYAEPLRRIGTLCKAVVS